MKFPNNPEGYELRILDDDDDECKPEMAFPELDLNKKIIEYNLDSLAFCEIPQFKPKKLFGFFKILYLKKKYF